MEPLLRALDLAKSFRGRAVLQGLCLNVPAGSVYGLLGLNGSGKTTTLRILTGLLRADRGRVELEGRPLAGASARAGLAAVVDAPSFVPALSAKDNVKGHARLHGQSGCDAEAELLSLGLDPGDRRAVRSYSLGMKQRLALAMALATHPRLLILDEPANGLDPAGMAALRALLPRLAAERGVTILLSSHLLDEVEHCCTHVGILRAGHVSVEAPLRELQQRAGWRVAARDAEALQRVATRAWPRARVEAQPDGCLITNCDEPAEKVLQTLVGAGLELTHFARARVLETVLLQQDDSQSS